MPGITSITQASPVSQRWTLRVIDDRGDKRAFGFGLSSTSAVSDATLNAFLQAYSDATNAYVYGLEITNVYGVLPLAVNANDLVFASADQIVGVLYKPVVAGNSDVRLEIRAPIGDMVIDGEVVDITNADYIAVRDAFDAVITALSGEAYAPVSARFTERRDKNSAVPA